MEEFLIVGSEKERERGVTHFRQAAFQFVIRQRDQRKLDVQALYYYYY